MERRGRVEVRLRGGRIRHATSLDAARRMVAEQPDEVVEVWLVWPNDLAGASRVELAEEAAAWAEGRAGAG